MIQPAVCFRVGWEGARIRKCYFLLRAEVLA